MAETKEYVRIKKAPCRSIWYADKIGSIFPSLGTWENAYKVDSPDRVLYIRKEDAELIITENRRPKNDERVLITEGISSSGDYKTGDICTVRSVVDIYSTITVKEHSNYVIAREYEVIVNSEVKKEDGTEHEASAENLFTEPMTEEVKQLRCKVADLIGENERLKEDRKKLVGMFVKSLALNASLMDDLMPEWRHFAKEELNDLEEALK